MYRAVSSFGAMNCGLGSGVSRCFMQSLPNRVRPNETPRYAEMRRIEAMSNV